MKKISYLIISALIITSIFTFKDIPTASTAFVDVPAGHPYKSAIDFVESQGIVGGYPDGTYQPDRVLNRAEFIKIIISSRYTPGEIDSCLGNSGFYKTQVFSDIEPGVWFEKYVCIAKKNGIINGFPDGTFRGTQSIIFAEAAKITVNSYSLEVGTGDPWFAPFLIKLAEKGAIPASLLQVADSTQRGIKELTRGEMAEIIFLMGASVEDQVVSDDGSLSITVPETSLPGGVEVKHITIKRISQENAPMQQVAGAPMIFYDLGPDKLNFKEPITFKISIPTQGNVIPLVFLISGDSFEMLPEPIIEIDQATQTASLTAQISHFSSVGIVFVDLFESTITTPEDQVVLGDQFMPDVVVRRNDRNNVFTLDGFPVSITVRDQWTLRRGTFQDVFDVLSPFRIKDLPLSKNFSGVGSYSPSTTAGFTCENVTDNASLLYLYDITLEYDLNTPTLNSVNQVTATIVIKTNPFRCVSDIEAQLSKWRDITVDNINGFRADAGVAPLTVNDQLSDIAQIHAEDMGTNLQNLSHQGSLGEESFDRMKEGQVINLDSNTYQFLPVPGNIVRTGENIAVRNIHDFGGSIEDALNDIHDTWNALPVNEDNERSILLSQRLPFTEIGIGMYLDDSGNLWLVEDYISTQ